MRNLLFLFSTCVLFACNGNDTPTPQPQNNNNTTTPADTFLGTLITDYHNGGTHDRDTIENCQLLPTIFGDTVMKVRLIIPDPSVNLSLSAQADIDISFSDNFGITRTGIDSCTQMVLKISTDGNNVEYEHERTCDPGTDYYFTGTK